MPVNCLMRRAHSARAVCQLLVCLGGFQSLRQLIGAGGGLHAALDALDTGDDVVNVHPFHQLADALQVAVAAAYKLNILDLFVLNVEENLLGTGAFCLVFVHADFLSIQ